MGSQDKREKTTRILLPTQSVEIQGDIIQDWESRKFLSITQDSGVTSPQEIVHQIHGTIWRGIVKPNQKTYEIITEMIHVLQ